MSEIATELIQIAPWKEVVPEEFPLLRTIQFTLHFLERKMWERNMENK